MAHKRVVRVISYEGIDEWIDEVMDRCVVRKGKVLFTRVGTIKELARVELTIDQEGVPLYEILRRELGT